MTQSRITGIFWITAGLALFAALAYEPANLVNLLGLQNRADEATVVVAVLGVVLACATGGVVALRSKGAPGSLR